MHWLASLGLEFMGWALNSYVGLLTLGAGVGACLGFLVVGFLSLRYLGLLFSRFWAFGLGACRPGLDLFGGEIFNTNP